MFYQITFIATYPSAEDGQHISAHIMTGLLAACRSRQAKLVYFLILFLLHYEVFRLKDDQVGN